MATINEHFLNLKESYLFTEIANRVAEYTEQHPEKKMIRLGIGDVTLPLTSAVVSSLHKAVDDMAAPETFHGYGPEQGYLFVRQAIVRWEGKGLLIDTELPAHAVVLFDIR